MFASDEAVNSSDGNEASWSSDEDDTASSVVPSTSSLTSTTSPLQLGDSLSTIPLLPSQIWQEEWVPPVGRYIGLFGMLETFSDSVYDIATDAVNYEALELRGHDVVDLANKLKDMIKVAIKSRDFTALLVPEREFFV